MREDMAKVIVERPRLIHSNQYDTDGRIFRNREDAPSRLGMQKGYSERKHFNENLAPLRRFLEKQVNRPWDKVYADIRAQIDGRSTVQQHILQHIDNFVAVQTVWDDATGEVMLKARSWTGSLEYLRDTRIGLYVDPRTGILRKNRHYISYANQRRKQLLAEKQESLQRLRVLDANTQLHKIDGLWYRIELADIPPPHIVIDEDGSQNTVNDTVWDVVCKAWVSRMTEHPLARAYACAKQGIPLRYAKSKRQLSAKEMKEFKLS